MSNQLRTIMGACDYSIASLQNIKASLMDYGNPHKELNTAVGGLIITLTSCLIRLCQETFVQTAQSDNPSAKEDIQIIQAKFHEFMQRMIDNHE